MQEKLQQLRNLLDNANFDSIIPVPREDLAAAVKLAETVGLDVSDLLEKSDAMAQGFIGRLQRQNHAIGELVGRIGMVESTLRDLCKDPDISPEFINAMGTIVGILRNGVKSGDDKQ